MHEDTKYAIVINVYMHVGRICITITLDANYDLVYYLDSALCMQDRQTALHIACENEHFDVTRILVDMVGTHINIKDKVLYIVVMMD